jgi:hypothetical protein
MSHLQSPFLIQQQIVVARKAQRYRRIASHNLCRTPPAKAQGWGFLTHPVQFKTPSLQFNPHTPNTSVPHRPHPPHRNRKPYACNSRTRNPRHHPCRCPWHRHRWGRDCGRSLHIVALGCRQVACSNPRRALREIVALMAAVVDAFAGAGGCSRTNGGWIFGRAYAYGCAGAGYGIRLSMGLWKWSVGLRRAFELSFLFSAISSLSPCPLVEPILRQTYHEQHPPQVYHS